MIKQKALLQIFVEGLYESEENLPTKERDHLKNGFTFEIHIRHKRSQCPIYQNNFSKTLISRKYL